jgi:hypothetical protein
VPKKAASTALAPASTAHLTPHDADRLFDNPFAAPAIETFEKIIGGRGDLAGELLTSPDLTPPIRKILTLILDPRFDTYPLAKLCDQAGILPGDVFRAFRDATIAKANIQALRRVAERLVTITESLLDDASDRMVICDECSGSKQQLIKPKKGDPTIIDCTRCNGTGTVMLRADFEKQKLALELGGLLKKGPAVQLNQQTNHTLNLSTGAGGIAQLQQAVSGMLFGRNFTPDLATDDPSVVVVTPVDGQPDA